MARTADRRLLGRKYQKVTIENLGPNSMPLIYVKVTEEQIVATKEYLPGVNIDLDSQGRLCGIELLNAEVVVRADEIIKPLSPPSVLPYTTYTQPYNQGILGTWQ